MEFSINILCQAYAVMDATNRSARHKAACGSKPGGASAYYLKESCVNKKNAAKATAEAKMKAANKSIAMAELGKLGRYMNAAATEYAKSPNTMDVVDPELINSLMKRMITPRYITEYPNIHDRYQASCKDYNKAVNRSKKRRPVVDTRDVNVQVQVMRSCEVFWHLAIEAFFKPS